MTRGTIVVFCGLTLPHFAAVASASPSWAKDGNCTACHSLPLTGTLSLMNHDTIADPGNDGSPKVFRAQPGETRQLFAAVGGLTPGDRYMVMLKGFSNPGVQQGQLLAYGADCGWAGWWNHFYTDPPRDDDPSYSYAAPSGPSHFQYDLQIGADCPSDYYDLTFALVGIPKEGTALFYTEEHFYLQVTTPSAPPTVSITSPRDNTVFPPAPADVIIAADASDSDGSIVKIEFYADGVLLGEDRNAPYTFTWLHAGRGNHTLVALAMDDSLVTTTSTPVHIIVPRIPGDSDGDGDVDQVDFGFMQRCLDRPAASGQECADADLNTDTIVDKADMDLFEQCASGPQIRSSPGCLD